MTDLYEYEFGSLGQEIAGCLDMFSLDLCGIICQYLLHRLPKKDKTPIECISFKILNNDWKFNMAIHPLDHSIWLTSYGGLIRLNEHGHFDLGFAVENTSRIAINSFGTIFATVADGIIRSCIQLFSPSGKFIKNLETKFFLESMIADDRGYVYTNTHTQQKIDCWNNNGELIKSLSNQDPISTYILGINQNNCLILKSYSNRENLIEFNPETGKTTYIPYLSCDSITTDRVGNFYLLSSNMSCIQVLNKHFMPLTTFHINPATSLCIDKQGKIYVREKNHVRVLVFQ